MERDEKMAIVLSFIYSPSKCSRDVNILGGSAHTVKENAEALLVPTKEIGLEVNTDKTKYMVMYRDWNAGWGCSVKLIIVPLKGWKC